MNICIVTGSSGLIGSESVAFFAYKFQKTPNIFTEQKNHL